MRSLLSGNHSNIGELRNAAPRVNLAVDKLNKFAPNHERFAWQGLLCFEPRRKVRLEDDLRDQRGKALHDRRAQAFRRGQAEPLRTRELGTAKFSKRGNARKRNPQRAWAMCVVMRRVSRRSRG